MKMKLKLKKKGVINQNIPWALVNLGIIALVVFALYIRLGLWSFLGLLCMHSTKTSHIPAKCPKCGCKFIAIAEEDDDD